MKNAAYVGAASLLTLLIGIPTTHVLTALGVLGLLVAGGMFAAGSGRVGPQTKVKNSASCCGCSCVVLMIVFPATSALAWMAHGVVASIAAVPVTVVLLHAIAHATPYLNVFEAGRSGPLIR